MAKSVGEIAHTCVDRIIENWVAAGWLESRQLNNPGIRPIVENAIAAAIREDRAEMERQIASYEGITEDRDNTASALATELEKHSDTLAALTIERQRREEAASDRRELLMMLAGRPDITGLLGFKEKAIYEAARGRNNGELVPTDREEERGG